MTIALDRKNFIFRFISIFGIVFVLFFLFFLAVMGFFLVQTPDVRWLKTENPKTTSIIVYREKVKRTSNMQMDRNWEWVPIHKISNYLIHSVIISEDQKYFEHKGFDWSSMWEAMIENLKNMDTLKGGSTITQQVAKNIFLEPSRSLLRKIREATIAYKLEKFLDKTRILELYLNVIEWGDGIYGVEAASKYYFKKPSNELNLIDSLRLSSVIPNPHKYSPLDISDRYLKERIKHVSKKLLKKSWISQIEYDLVMKELFNEIKNEKPKPVPVYSKKIFNPYFWISKIANPNKVIMNEHEINAFNYTIMLSSGGIDIFGLPDFLSEKDVKNKIKEVVGFTFELENILSEEGYFSKNNRLDLIEKQLPLRYDINNNLLNTVFYNQLKNEIDLISIPKKVKISYGLIAQKTNLLSWPIDSIIMSKPYDYKFNKIQQSVLNVGTPVAILHSSKNSKWFFIRTKYVDGWIKKEDVALTNRVSAANYPGNQFLVITSRAINTKSGVRLEMGTQIPWIKKYKDVFEINLPTKGDDGKLTFKKDLISSKDVNKGYLKYTQKNIIHQAFKLLDSSYGWGGSKNGWDCSLFIQDIFKNFNIQLPRNSWWQGNVGQEIVSFSKETSFFKKKDIIQPWIPGTTLLHLPGHIMLYLGKYEKMPYAIHAIYGITSKNDDLVLFDKVTVTDLDLGKNGSKGSLFERILDVRSIQSIPLNVSIMAKDFFRWFSSHEIRFITIKLLIGSLIFIYVIIILIKYIAKHKTNKIHS